MADLGLYPEAAQLSGENLAQSGENYRQEKSDTAAAQRSAGAEVGAMSRQIQGERADQQKAQQAQQARMQLEKMKQDSGWVEVTPQMALGLVNVNKNPEYMKMVGQKMRKEQFAGFLNLEWKIKEAKMKQPKPFRIIQGKNTVDGYMTWDEDSQSWVAKTIPGSGGPRGDLSKSSGASSKEESTERDRFLKHYETQQGKLAAAQKSLSYDPNNAAVKSQVQELQAYINDNKARYDQLHRTEASSGGYRAPTDAAGTGGGGDSIDDIFNEAIEKGGSGPASPGGGPMEIQSEEPSAEEPEE